MDDEVVRQLAANGVLRAAINLSNFLLVSGRDANGDPEGVAPDLAREIAARLGVGVRFVPYRTPAALAADAGQDAWDIGLIGAEPQRAAQIAFTAAYCEIEATYLVPPASTITAILEVDRPGRSIAVTGGAAYGLWLERNVQHARLVRSETLDAAFDAFVSEKLDALAGLRTRLIEDARRLPGARVLDGQFTAVQQAVGTARTNEAAATWLRTFVEEAKASGLVARLIQRHRVSGLAVAPPA